MHRRASNLTVLRLPKMKRSEIERLIKEQFLCRIAFRGEEYPYIAPFQYVLLDGILYFHFTSYGRKMQLMKKDRQVCVEIEQYNPDLSRYMFATLKGKLKVVTDTAERAKAIEKMRKFGEEKLSPNFLAAHGLKTTYGWASFAADKAILIVKLDKLTEETGLKSPANPNE
jgi:nitroimidazol reductase NimA-like FMN-containing flavoprotein (pyridoxamine 5'-phosphate oxidase superfamily)